jgi:hypothetical protein
VKKKILLGALGLFALALGLLATLLVLSPWLVNRLVVKAQIEHALSRALGGPVTYERASLSILPHPHVMISTPRLSLPGRLSGTVKSINMYAELRPLFSGAVRITAVRLDHPDVALFLSANERPSETPVFGVPPASLIITKGRLTVTQNQRRLVTLQEIDMRIDALPPSLKSGNERTTSTEPFHITGSLQGNLTDVPSLPGPVSFTIARFDARPETLSFSDARVRLLDTPFVVSGQLDDYLTTLRAVDLEMNGAIGPETVGWIRTLTALPPEMTLHSPVTLSRGRLVWHRDGALGLKGTASVQNNVVVSFDVSRTPDRFSVQSLEIRDAESQAALTMTLKKKALILSFSGYLSQTTLNNLFEHERFQFGSVRGDLDAHIALNRPMDSTLRGTLEGKQLVPPFTLNAPVIINRVSLKAAGRTATVNPLVVTVGDKSHTITGDITASADGWLLDVKSDGLEWEPLQALFKSGQETASTEPPAVPDGLSDMPQQAALPVRVTLRLDAAYFSAGGWTARSARAEIVYNPDTTHIRLNEARVCGIHLSGTATVQAAHLELNIRTTASRLPLAPTLDCLSGKDLRITGTYDLSGAFTSHGKTDAWADNLRGSVSLMARDGRIYHDLAFIKALEYLNTTDLLKGKFPDPEREGVPYHSIDFRSTLEHPILRINQVIIVSPVADVTGRGSINLAERTIDSTYLVAPFPSADAVIKNIPLVKDILGGSLLTIPLQVKGPYKDPTVTPLPPEQVADELGSMMKRLLTLPFKLISPFLPNVR